MLEKHFLTFLLDQEIHAISAYQQKSLNVASSYHILWIAAFSLRPSMKTPACSRDVYTLVRGNCLVCARSLGREKMALASCPNVMLKNGDQFLLPV